LKHALPAAAATTTTISITALTAHRLDILILATAASTVLWISYRMNHLASRIQTGVGETRTDVHGYRAEVHELQRHTNIGKLLKTAGRPIDDEEPLTLPTPQGPIRAIATEIDGDTAIFGVDAATELADILDLRPAITEREDEAAL
jgi:hypothetical protein